MPKTTAAPRTPKAHHQPTTDAIRFGTVGAPSSTPHPGGTPLAIAHARALGLDHLEIAWVQSVRVTDESCAAIKAAAEQYGVSLSVHAPYYINLNSQTDDLMRKSDERLLLAARKGYLAGARDIIFHPGSYHNQPPETVYDRVRDKLREITTILKNEGVHVTLRPETMGKGAMFGTLEETIQLGRDVPGVLPAIDFAHLHARTGKDNSYKEFARMVKAVKDGLGQSGLESLHCHLSGIEYGEKGEKQHLPLNESDMRYRELLQALVDAEARGVIAAEAPDPFHVADALTFQATYRRLHDLKAGIGTTRVTDEE
ncbi:MAG TPA: TIM barrel protein [Aggregatilineales bacterium]|nr:TIM barrel protein [Anaerolineales bacterium]HRE49084.1 TIM barrel protein [Aggregatilineales bacterium]